MDTLFVIIFVFIMKLLTYFLPAIIYIGMLIVLIGAFFRIKHFFSRDKEEPKKGSESKSKFMQFGQYMEEDDKRRGGGSF
jgi:hypothetical protein